ncbi:transglutaminase domain-containing protein [Spirosoma rhododendri]|uniref:DUF3857 domain-containing protein n=1 Tax=Spirosoma rhododendri TaxID=2728024 RepID=A0A7L5DQW7_9BACT|nr:transglutaminase domain-containing protein [Spirosoma rhododendri]QJD80839.1 DUF3857 domain-containing protein [Spirosoma rhododendri]
MIKRFTVRSKSLCLFTLALLYALTSYAQKGDRAKTGDSAPVVKFGQAAPADFSSASMDSAGAVVLYKYGEVRFDVISDQLWLITTHHVRTRINKKSAYDLATIELPVRRGKAGQHEHINYFEGYTYNLVNGQVEETKLPRAGHFTDRADDAYQIEKYTLSNVREGSIIEYKYELRTPFAISHTPRTWYFQQSIPVKWSEYRITIPNYFYYNIIQTGYLPIAVNEHNEGSMTLIPGEHQIGYVAYRFAVKDAPAFRDEAYITTDEDYLSKIDFEMARYILPGNHQQTFSLNWTDLDNTLLGDASFGGQLKRGGFMRETAQTIIRDHADTLARVTAAYDFIRKRMKWNNKTSIWSNNVKTVYEAGKGDAADINLLLIAMLREMNLDANPVILSTRSHGRIDESFALLKKFNYVVAHVWVGNKDLLLDATDSHLIPGMLTRDCLNGQGRLIHPQKARFIALNLAERSVETVTARLSISEEGDVSGAVQMLTGGHAGWETRREIATNGRTKYNDELRKERPGWQFDSVSVDNSRAGTTAVVTSCTVAIANACSQAGDRLYFRPMLTEGHHQNPFKGTERLYPVDFGVLVDETFTATYTLPAGYKVEELPKRALVVMPNNGGRYAFDISVNERNELQVLSRLALRQPVYPAVEYEALRELFALMVAKQAEQVVLKRTTTAAK